MYATTFRGYSQEAWDTAWAGAVMTRSTVLRLEDVVMDAMKPFPPLDQSSDCGESCSGIFMDGIIAAWAVLILLLSKVIYGPSLTPGLALKCLWCFFTG